MWDLPPPDPGIEIVVATRGMSKGVAQTEGPQLIARPFVQLGPVQVGAQWKNVSSPVAGGEAAAFANVAPKLGKFQLNLGIAYKFQTGVKEPTDDKSWEFTGSVARKFGKMSLRLAAVYSPDDLGGARRSIFIEGGPTVEIDKSTRISAAIGRRDRIKGDDYTAFNVGVTRTIFKGVTLDARFYGTNRSDISEFFEDRFVATARMAF
ncbi:MAG TPA: TorF family putative porin [Sphingomicrobium sp.]|nr:TorF family putative porin [Sphingomicrobium sp.]